MLILINTIPYIILYIQIGGGEIARKIRLLNQSKAKKEAI